MAHLLGGIDEAGRGCLIGKLFVAGVSLDQVSASRLKQLGVRDSKTLTPERRSELYEDVLSKSGRVVALGIQPNEIDAVVRAGRKYRRLNYLEAVYFARVADELRPDYLVVDASDSNPTRFRQAILENMRTKCRILSKHKADRDYVVVSAASIIAKVERDRAIEKLRRELGDFGSGYPSDPVTRNFFEEKMKRGESLPVHVRRSWKTWGRLQQTVLSPDEGSG